MFTQLQLLSEKELPSKNNWKCYLNLTNANRLLSCLLHVFLFFLFFFCFYLLHIIDIRAHKWNSHRLDWIERKQRAGLISTITCAARTVKSERSLSQTFLYKFILMNNCENPSSKSRTVHICDFCPGNKTIYRARCFNHLISCMDVSRSSSRQCCKHWLVMVVRKGKAARVKKRR